MLGRGARTGEEGRSFGGGGLPRVMRNRVWTWAKEWAGWMSHPEIVGFQDVVKIKNKISIFS